MNGSENLKVLLQDYARLLLPDYLGNCIVNIPDHIKYLHGLKAKKSPKDWQTKEDKKTTKTALFVIDGFGYKQWKEHQAASTVLTKFANPGNLRPLTAMFPSSTAVSLSALSTGLTTQQHGLLEWWIYEEDLDQIIAPLPFMSLGEKVRGSLLTQHVDTSRLLNVPTLFEDLSSEGVKSYTLISRDYADGAYSSLAYQGSEIIAHQDVTQLFSNLSRLMLLDERAHFNIYWATIDAAGHTYGPNSSHYALEVMRFFEAFEAFLKTAPKENAQTSQLMITADHGQLAVDPNQTIWLDELPELTENLAQSQNGKRILPWGLQRDIYLKIKPDKLDDMYNLLTTQLKDRAVIIRSCDALSAGLFGNGKVHPRFQNRLGNLIVLPLRNNTIWYKHYPEEQFRYKGMHGGLTQDEMQVPFAQCSLGSLVGI